MFTSLHSFRKYIELLRHKHRMLLQGENAFSESFHITITAIAYKRRQNIIHNMKSLFFLSYFSLYETYRFPDSVCRLQILSNFAKKSKFSRLF